MAEYTLFQGFMTRCTAPDAVDTELCHDVGQSSCPVRMLRQYVRDSRVFGDVRSRFHVYINLMTKSVFKLMSMLDFLYETLANDKVAKPFTLGPLFGIGLEQGCEFREDLFF